MRRKSTLTFLLAFLLFSAIFFYEDLLYGLTQAKGQVNILLKAEPLEDFLQNPEFPDSLKQKILFIEEVRSYAIDSIGMKNSENYTTLYNQLDSAILWVVNAAPPFKISAHEWCFPIAGCFPYKGFFEQEKARKEQQIMLSRGYDAYLREVDGWSTLGFFNDPILSNMLKESDGELAELIIHELTHASIYVKDSADFNESLANFIGKQGAKAFLKQKFGEDSPKYRHYLARLQDSELFGRKMFRSILQIQRFYDQLPDTLPTLEKNILKYQTIKEYICAINRNEFNHPNRFKWLELDEFLPNNAYFSLFLTYNNQEYQFQDELDSYQGKLKDFFNALQKEYGK